MPRCRRVEAMQRPDMPAPITTTRISRDRVFSTAV
ncbi:Uncharacterised protein [Mycobacteroides abscessus subsp. abscessus]|nr:Uncharacterised protein [Mycobacteroides abscessus subsp. abscessus]